MCGLPQKQNARRAYKIRLCGHLRRYKKTLKKTYIISFNSLISLGYSIILNEFYGKIEGKGLNPYFGVMHSDHEKYPTLASDLMEK